MDGEAGAAVGRLVDGDRAAVGVDDGGDDREAEAERAAAVAGAADEALEQRLADLGGDARAVVGDDELGGAVGQRRACVAVTCVPGGVWRSAFSIRFVATRWRSSRLPRVRRAGWTSSSSTCSWLEGSSSLAASTTMSARSTGSRGGAWPASARASSSRSPTSRRIRCVERSADSRGLAVGAVGASRRAARGSRARSSAACAARARRRRRTCAGGRASPRSRCAPRASAASMPLERARELGDLVVGVGSGSVRLGSRVRSISPAAAVSSAIGVIARRATSDPAPNARTVPTSTPRAATARGCRSRAASAATGSAVLHDRSRRRRRSRSSVGRDDAVAVASGAGRRVGDAERRVRSRAIGGRRRCRSRTPPPLSMPA